MRRSLLALFVMLSALGILLAMASSAAAELVCTQTWDGGAGTADWATAGNWSGDQVPISTDTACVPSTATVNIDGSTTVEIAYLQNDGSLEVEGTLSLDGTDDPSTSADLTLTGTLTGAGTVRVLDHMTWGNFGFMDGSGTTVVETDATIATVGDQYRVLGSDGEGRVLEIAEGGTLEWTEGTVYLGTGAVIDNAGTFVADGSFMGNWSDTPAGIHNAGDLVHDVATTTSVSGVVPVDNDGTISVTDGTLRLSGGDGPGVSTGDFSADDPGALFLGGVWDVEDVAVTRATVEGTMTVADGFTAEVSDLTLTGTLTGAGTVRVLDHMTWGNFGFMDGSGTTVVETDATIATVGDQYRVLGSDGEGRVLEIAEGGTLEWTEGTVYLGTGAVIDNAGTFVADGSFMGNWSDTPAGIHNAGDLVHDVATTTSVSGVVPVDNDGTISVTDGTLRLSGGDGPGVSTGDFSADDPGALFLGGVWDVEDVAVTRATVEGTMTVADGFTAEVSDLTLTGTLTGAGTVRVLDHMTWGNFGFMDGSGTTVVETDATIATVGDQYRVLGSDGEGRVLEIAEGGTLEWTEGTVYLGTGAVIDNAGTFVADGSFMGNWSDTPAGIHNAGDLVHDVATTTSVSGVVPVDNDGTISVTDGTLRLSGPLGGYSTATKTLAGGTYEVVAPGVLDIAVLDVATNSATIRLVGTSAGFVAGSEEALRSLAENDADGTIEILEGRDLTTPVAFANAGVVRLGQGSTLTTVGNFSQSSGETRLLAPTSEIDARGSVEVVGGEVWGVGTIIGTSIENVGGTLRPGSSPGALTLDGDFEQGPLGTIDVELGGTTPGSGFDVISVNGSAVLGGTLSISSLDPFLPSPGEAFTILTAASRTGTFDDVVGLQQGDQLLEVRYDPGAVTLLGAQVRTLAIDDVEINEGDSGTRDLVFTVSSSGDAPGSASVEFASADDSATAPEDYTSVSGVLSFGPGEKEETIAVPIVGDLLDEVDESFTVELSNVSGASLVDAVGIGSILDDDEPPSGLLTVQKVGDGTGTVVSSPAGIACGATCAFTFHPGTVVELTATAGTGSSFAGWNGGGCTGVATCVLTMDQARTVTATFSQGVHRLTVTDAGTGEGSVGSNPAAINCEPTCVGDFPSGTEVTLVATPDLGSYFAGWSGACTGTGICRVTMDGARSVTATFNTNPTGPDFNLTISPGLQTLPPGESVSYVVGVAVFNGFSDPVTLSVVDPPNGVTAHFDPPTVTPPGTSILTLTASADLEEGTFDLVVRGTSGGITHDATGSVGVDFGLIPVCHGAVEGIVTDAEDGEPLEGVVVRYGIVEAETDEHGHYRIDGLGLGENNSVVEFTLLGRLRPVYWDAGPKGLAVCGQVTELDFAMVPVRPAQVTGRVVEGIPDPLDPFHVIPTTTPIEDASLDVRLGSERLLGGPVRSDADGDYAIAFVLGQDNAPLEPHLTVRTVCPDGGATPAECTPQAFRSGYWDSWYPGIYFPLGLVEKGDELVRDIALVKKCTGSISGQVVYADTGLLVPEGIHVQAAQGIIDGANTTTGVDGRFEFPSLLLGFHNTPGRYGLSASQQDGDISWSGNATSTLDVCGEHEQVTIEMSRSQPRYGNVEGYVFEELPDGSPGDPVEGAEVCRTIVGPCDPDGTDADGYYLIERIRLSPLLGDDESEDVGIVVNTSRPLGQQFWTPETRTVAVFPDRTSRLDHTILRRQYAGIAGTVTDQITKDPIDGAVVVVDEGCGADCTRADDTDAFGDYALDHVQLGFRNVPRDAPVRITAPGYWPMVTTAHVIANHVTTLNVELIPICEDAEIGGRVVNAFTQEPIEGARVDGGGKSAFTKVDGSYRLTGVRVGTDNSPIPVTLFASAEGFYPQTKTVTIFCGAKLFVEFGKDDETSTIEGYVTDISGPTPVPIEGVFIGSGFGGSDVTDENGYYRLTRVPLGGGNSPRVWTITADPDAFPAKSEDVTVRLDEVARQDFQFGALPPSASLNLVKTATPHLSSPPRAGDTITYGFAIANEGNVTLSSVQLTDALVGFSGATCGGASSLAPGATTTCSATYALSQTDVNAGTVHNAATACGTPPSGPDACDTDTTDTSIQQVRSLNLVKTATPHLSSPPRAGDTITYGFAIANEGNVTLSSVQLTDALVGFSGATCGGASSLAPGATTTCSATYALSQTDVNAGTVHNAATACGTPPSGPDACDTDTTDTSIQQVRSLNLVKTATPHLSSPPRAGDTITYGFAIANEGNVTLSSVQLTDALVGFSGATCGGASSLAPGATTTCSATYALSQTDVNAGTVHNAATACGTPPSGPDACDTDTTDTSIQQVRSLNLVKTATPHLSSPPRAGDTITYGFAIANEGNVTLSSVQLTDALVGFSGATCGGASSLAPGATTTCSATYALSQTDVNAGTVHNAATACGTPPSGPDACDTDTTDTSIQQVRSLNLVKTATPTTYSYAGQLIAYSYVITNTGNVTVTGPFVVADDKTTNGTCPATPTTLDPGAFLTCSSSYAVLSKDLDTSKTGSVTNHATATGRFETQTVSSNTAQATVRQVAATGTVAPTQTTCQQFRDGVAADLTDVTFQAKGTKIISLAPGVFFYYSAVTAPSGAFTLEVTQTNTTSWKPIKVQDLGQVILWNSGCTKTLPLTVKQLSNGSVHIDVPNGVATAGRTYYLSIKYDAGSLVGQSVSKPYPMSVYSFETTLNSTVISTSHDSVHIAPK